MGVALVLLGTGLRLAAPWYVRTHVLPAAAREYGLEVACDDVSLSVLAGAITLEGVTVRGGGEEIVRAGRLVFDTQPTTLTSDHPAFDGVEIDDAELHLVLAPDGRTTLSHTMTDAHRDATGGAPPPTLVVHTLRLTRCRVTLSDPARVKDRYSIDMTDIAALGTDLQAGPKPDPSVRGTLDIDARLAQKDGYAPFTVIAWTQPGGGADGRAAHVAHAALTDLDLASFPQYVEASHRSMLGSDRIDIVGSMEVLGDTITKGALVGMVPGRDSPLVARFSGKLADPTVDTSGSLTALFELPFAHFGHLGTAVWRSGSSVVGGAVGIAESLGQGDLAGAGSAALGGVTGAAKSIGTGIFDAVKGLGTRIGNAIGIKSADEKRDVATIHAKLRQALVALRENAPR